MIVGAMIVGAMIVGAMIVEAMIVGAMIVGSMRLSVRPFWSQRGFVWALTCSYNQWSERHVWRMKLDKL